MPDAEHHGDARLHGDHFSVLDGLGIGKHVSSSTFSVGGCDWSILLFPDGVQTEDEGYVSMILYFLRGPAETRTEYSITLLFGEEDRSQEVSRRKAKQNRKRRKGLKVQTEKFRHTFNRSREPDWGWTEYVVKSKLRRMLLGCNDCFTIRCVLTVLKSRTEDAAAIVVPESDLHQDFANMLRDGDGADVTIAVGDRFFLAHKHVLAARSRFFKAQLFGAMKESNTECLKIEDMEPSVFERLLHFIYTDSLSEDYEGDDRNVAMLRLLAAADKYGLKRLRLMCEEKLCRWIDVQSVSVILGVADQYQRVQLKEACLGFIASPDVLGAVMETEGFKDLIASCPLIMKEILDKIASADSD